MDEGTVLVLIIVAAGAAALLAALLLPVTFPRLGAVGTALGLAFWIAMAIVIYRGPDNPDLGEDGWTIVVGIYTGILVAAWWAGAGLGCVLRRTVGR